MKTAYCFDLDGTLTKTEVLPCIASELGISDEMATLTQVTMDGHIDFEASFKLRCLILSRVPIEVVQKIILDIPLDKSILKFIQSRRDSSFLVTGNLDVWVKPIAELCGCRLYSSEATQMSESLKIEKILRKDTAIAGIRALGFGRVVAVGDGANDIAMFNASDISIAYGGVHSPAPGTIAACNYVFHDGEVLCKMLEAL